MLALTRVLKDRQYHLGPITSLSSSDRKSPTVRWNCMLHSRSCRLPSILQAAPSFQARHFGLSFLAFCRRFLLASLFLRVSFHGPVWTLFASFLNSCHSAISVNQQLQLPRMCAMHHSSTEVKKGPPRPPRTVTSTHALVRVTVHPLQPVTGLSRTPQSGLEKYRDKM